MQATTVARAERLLTALSGVVSARVVADQIGRLAEIHVLATPDLHPKQIVRNVESALSAGLGVIVDRRIISVAQLRANTSDAYMAREMADARGAAREAVRGRERAVYVEFQASSTSSLDTSCTVVLRFRTERVTGHGAGLNTAQGRADAAARAVFNALQEAGEQLGLEGTAIVDLHGRAFVLVSARAVAARRASILTGLAVLTRSPEEGAIYAALQATNRVATFGPQMTGDTAVTRI